MREHSLKAYVFTVYRSRMKLRSGPKVRPEVRLLWRIRRGASGGRLEWIEQST